MPSTPLPSRMEDIYDVVLYTLWFQSCAPPVSVLRNLLSPSTLSSDASPLFQTLPKAAPAFLLTLESPSSVKVAPAIAAQAPQVRQSAPLSSIPRDPFSPRLPTLASPLTNKQPPHIVEAFLTVQAHIQADPAPKTSRSTCPAVTSSSSSIPRNNTCRDHTPFALTPAGTLFGTTSTGLHARLPPTGLASLAQPLKPSTHILQNSTLLPPPPPPA